MSRPGGTSGRRTRKKAPVLSDRSLEASVSVTQERQVELSLGANEILLYSVEDYRLTGNRICFELTGYISGNKVAVDSPRRYCTRIIDNDWWSMR